MGRIATPTYLGNHELVLGVLGYWPAFHDGEVISLTLDRSTVLFDTVHNPRIELLVHALEWPSELKEGTAKHHLVHFAFESVSEVKLADFNHQNAIHGLLFEEHPISASGNPSFTVTIDGALGLTGQFVARSGCVVAVIPCDAQGKSLKS